MGKALYRKYRSKSLDEIVGQSHITNMLSRSIAKGTVAHAYLLTGPRGVGKTSIARILAHEINKLPYSDESTHLDIIEIDAASNNGVEDIRDLREKVQIAPTSASKKIYIIDEVHMLSKSAFNALLKTLEEPPEHVVFILATTDADKLPATIISRVQRFNFRSIGAADAKAHLRMIADTEKIGIDDAALDLIALHGNGSFRDSISLLDQLRNISDGQITAELIESVLGLADATTVTSLLNAYESNNLAVIVETINNSEADGTPAFILAEQLMRTIREQILDKPHLLPLLDKLPDVARSAWPHVKLLTALSSAMPPAAAPVPAKPTPEPKPQPKAAPTPAKPNQTAEEPAAIKVAKKDSAEFPWADFLAELKKKAMGTFTLVSGCDYYFADEKLTIYAGKKFTKNQIEKALATINKALQKVGMDDTEVDVLASNKPASDSQTAAVLAMMGGGEEVKL